MSKLVCVQLRNESVEKLPWDDANFLVTTGKASFISRTEFKALSSGVKVPTALFEQGDRAVKDFVAAKLAPKKKEAKVEKIETPEEPKPKKGKKQ